MTSHVAFGTLVAVCVSSVVAFADVDPMAPPKDARAAERLKQGNRHYRLRDFQAAIAEYKAGAAIEEAGVFWYNLGQSYRQLGNYEEALWYYQRFLDRAHPKGELRAGVLDFIAKMTAERDKAASKQPPTEAGGDLDPGKVRGSKTSSPAGTGQVPTGPAVNPTKEPAGPNDGAEDSEQPSWHNDIVGWSLLGAGVVGLGVGTGFLVSSAGLDKDADNGMSENERARLLDRAESRRTLGFVVGGVGGALAVAGIIKLALVPERNASAVQLSAGSTGTGFEVALSGRF